MYIRHNIFNTDSLGIVFRLQEFFDAYTYNSSYLHSFHLLDFSSITIVRGINGFFFTTVKTKMFFFFIIYFHHYDYLSYKENNTVFESRIRNTTVDEFYDCRKMFSLNK